MTDGRMGLTRLACFFILLFQSSFAKVNLDDLAAWQAFYDATNGAEWPDCAQLRNKPCLCGTDEPIVARNIESFITFTTLIFIGGVGVECKEVEIPDTALVEERIVGISMPEWNLTGTLPKELNKLSELTHLGLGNNNLKGKVNPVCGLSKLKHLHLYGNRFEGSLPPCLGYYDDLRSLNLAGNLFRGKVPKSLGKLSVLRELVLSEQNTFRPDELPDDPKKRARCRLLKRAYVEGANNDFLFRWDRLYTCGGLSGALPKEMKGMLWLRVLALAGNAFYDTLPEWLPRGVEYLDLSDNHFRTPWPKKWGKKSLRGMLHLKLSYNDLELSFHEIFPTIRQWAETIKGLELSGTGLSGHLPALRYRAPSLAILKVADNDIIGELPELPGIMQLDLRNNSKMYGDLEHHHASGCHAIRYHADDYADDDAFKHFQCYLEGTGLQTVNPQYADMEIMEMHKEGWEMHKAMNMI